MDRKLKQISIVVLSIVISASLIVVGGCATGESTCNAGYDFSKVKKIAVVDVIGDIEGETAKNQISNYLEMELLRKGYSPIERSQVQSLLDEQQFQAGEITSSEDAVQAGRVLNVSTVMIMNLDYGEKMTMTAKMLDVEDGRILWIGSGSGKTGKGLITIVGAVVGAAAGAVAGGDDSGSRIGGAIAGGILGGIAGEALTPQQAEKVQEVIKKMCKGLPFRM